MKSNPKTKAPKPLLELKAPLKAKVYRAKFKAFESTKFLDVNALKAAKHVTIECGTIEIAGMSQTVAAEIKNGMVVALKPLGCKGCHPKSSKKLGRSALGKTTKLVGQALSKAGIKSPNLPIPVEISAQAGFRIPIGPIVIVIGEPWIDVCIEIWIGNKFCWWCLFSPSGCIGFGPPELKA